MFEIKYLLIAGAILIVFLPQIVAFFMKTSPSSVQPKTPSRSAFVAQLIDMQDVAGTFSAEAAKLIGQAVSRIVDGDVSK